MDLSWIASPYGVMLGAMLCLLIGFIVSRGIYFDKDDKVLKIGSKHHPETLRQFNDLFGIIKCVRDDTRGMSGKVDSLAVEIDMLKKKNEEAQITMLKATITNTQLPPNLRAEAYDEYHNNRHKNGWVEAYYETEVKPLLKKQIQQDEKE